MEEIIHEIACADSDGAQWVLETVLERYRQLHPDWEICVISLEKSKDKAEQLDRIIEALQKMKASL